MEKYIKFEGEKWQVDVAVLCLFFNRPDRFSQVFEQVKKARPSKLFLYQDGSRNEEDIPNILACREIAVQIDWECEVYQQYQDQNIGCDPSGYLSRKWMFQTVDRGIILEDDCVPSIAFFNFCAQLLDKYADDERVSIISGINYEEITDYCPYDYFFTSDVAIWGWATWKRVIDKWDESYSFLDDKYEMQLVKENIKYRNLRNYFVSFAEGHRKEGKAYFESIHIMCQLLNSGLAIVPKKNMIHNIGMIGASTHFRSSVKTLPLSLRKIATMRFFELENENVNHPKYVIEDYSYNLRVNKILSRNSKSRQIWNSFVLLCLRIRYGEFKAILNSIKKRL